ncbi:PREDICTED: mucin-5B-like [Nanorana parkeri]|uniref:mucin-5B-like n=1 Tax=Nanorana parkeri TaxID=125878 RepID=UPI000854DEA2|nr:PREDICTED: mucin-5B-like [Nanorana parkeri]
MAIVYLCTMITVCNPEYLQFELSSAVFARRERGWLYFIILCSSPTFDAFHIYSSSGSTCILGQWTCSQIACSGNCTLKGGAHMHTYDGRKYSFHGNCQYLMSKDEGKKFSILAKVIQCGMYETVTCLNAVYIQLGKMKIKICYCGNVYVNNFLVNLPRVKENITIYRYAAYYIYIVTSFGLSVEVRVKPVFQLSISVISAFQNKTTGLCGNFNGNENDDFRTLAGVVETTISSFANSFKDEASCPDVPTIPDNPCAKSTDKGDYANHWCSQLINKMGVFASCHDVLDPKSYFERCKYDVCNLEKSEEVMCTWLADYASDCRSLNVLLPNWRDNICDPECPETMVFSLNPRHCNVSCTSLAEPDILCNLRSLSKEGCTCLKGMYLVDNEKCVLPEDCPCSYKGKSVPAHQTYKVDDILCKCIRGILECPNHDVPEKSTTCKKRTWACTNKHCPKTCTVYGNGHLISFDQSRKEFSGDCDYVLVQDFCPNNPDKGIFQVILKTIMCIGSNTVCSYSIKVTLLNTIIEIYEGQVEETDRHHNKLKDTSYSVGLVGQNIVLKNEYLTISYDQKLTATVEVTNSTEGKICGLCGNNDGQSNNDFTSPWSQSCEIKPPQLDPCHDRPERLTWAEKHCNIINSDVFVPCHTSASTTRTDLGILPALYCKQPEGVFKAVRMTETDLTVFVVVFDEV